NRVEDAAQQEPAAARDGNQFLLMVIGPPWRQRLELRSFDLEGFASSGVGAADHLVDEAAVGLEVGEVAAAAQQDGLLKRALEMRVRPFDRTVLVRHAGIVARRR